MVRHGFRALVLLSSVAAVLVYLAAALPAARGEGPADAVEAAVLAQANRLLDGAPAYLDASDPAPVVPMPGYAWIVSRLVGVDDARLWLLRQLALVATLFTAALVLVIVRVEAGGWTLPLAAAGLSLAGPALFGSAPGAARPESIALLLVLLGFATLRLTMGVLGALAAALLLAAAFFLHAPAVWFIVAAMLSLACEDRRRCTAFTVVALVAVGGGTLALSRLLGPWFTFAAWEAPLRELAAGSDGMLRFAADHLLGRLAPFVLVAVLSFALTTQPWNERRGIWMWLALAGVAASLGAPSHDAAEVSLRASILAVVLVGAIALKLVVGQLAEAAGDADPAGENVQWAGLLLQFFVLVALAPTPPWLPMALAAVGG
jgi:hypothetical protein